jgi:hypothetical protein
MDAHAPATPPSAKTFWLIWLSVTALPAGSFFYLWRFGPMSAKAIAFRQTQQGWEPYALSSPMTYRIQISDGGVTWVETITGLTRYEGGGWRRFTVADLGAKLAFPL